MNVQIRLIREGDYISFHKCLDSIAREGKYLAVEKAPDIEVIRKTIINDIKIVQSHFVAVYENEIIGFCSAKRYQTKSLSHRAEIGMGVIKEFRNNKIGEKLLLTTIDHTKQSGIIRLDLDVREDNYPAINLYSKCGFTEYARKKKGISHGDNYYDLVSMEYLNHI